MLPYIYTLFREASLTGLPVARPLFFVDPKDISLRDEDRAFMLGDDLLVVADIVPPPPELATTHEVLYSSLPTLASEFSISVALSPPSDSTASEAEQHARANKEAEQKSGEINSTDQVKLPKNHEWFNVFLCGDDEQAEMDCKDLPKLSARAGSIIPLGQPKQYVGEKVEGADNLTLLISFPSNSEKPKANGSLYEDAGDGYAFKDGDYLLRKFQAEYVRGSRTVSISIQVEGKMAIPERSIVFWVIIDGKYFVSAPVKDSEVPRLEFSIDTPLDSTLSHMLLRHVRSRE